MPTILNIFGKFTYNRLGTDVIAVSVLSKIFILFSKTLYSYRKILLEQMVRSGSNVNWIVVHFGRSKGSEKTVHCII